MRARDRLAALSAAGRPEGCAGSAQGRRRRPVRARRREEAAAAQPRRALHHLDPATGGGAEARLQREPDDAGGAAALRGGRYGEWRSGPHHLHADRLDHARGGGCRGDPRVHREGVRRPQRAAHATRVFRTRARNAQEAHEAIRPTSVGRTPESLAKVLPKDQAKLYELVWKRTVACQMKHATIDTVAVEFTCGAEPRPDSPVPDDLLRATGSSVADPGFLAVYEEGLDDKAAEKERRLPPSRRAKSSGSRRCGRSSTSPSRRRATPRRP